MTVSTLPQFDLRQTIRDTLARGKPVDVDAIVTQIIRSLPDSEIDRLVRTAVRVVVRDEILLSRTASHQGSPGSVGISRWKRNRIVIEGLGDRICVAGIWKLVADCTAEDLDLYAGEQRSRAKSLEQNARRASELASELRSAGASTVAELFASRERNVA